jgi:methyl-accepting chemotaxis protein
MSTDEFLVASKETEQQTELVANSIDEMSRTLQENAQSTHQATVMAETNREIATAGFEIVGKTVNKMRDIAGLVRNSAEEIEKLGDSSKKIGEIISVIDEIADQTNLLALNAAIEAARAGEQGRGFAVVADEVRKLAERTTDATKSITNMIQGIQQETQKAVNEMVRGTSEVTIGIELADQAGDSLNKVVSSSEEVLDMINQISASNAELSATGDEIAKHVVSISKMTKDSVNSLQEIADSANNLDKLNSKTSKFMTNFKISKHNGLNMHNQVLFDDEDDYYSEQHEMIALSDGNSYEM